VFGTQATKLVDIHHDKSNDLQIVGLSYGEHKQTSNCTSEARPQTRGN